MFVDVVISLVCGMVSLFLNFDGVLLSCKNWVKIYMDGYEKFYVMF